MIDRQEHGDDLLDHSQRVDIVPIEQLRLTSRSAQNLHPLPRPLYERPGIPAAHVVVTLRAERMGAHTLLLLSRPFGSRVQRAEARQLIEGQGKYWPVIEGALG